MTGDASTETDMLQETDLKKNLESLRAGHGDDTIIQFWKSSIVRAQSAVQ